jgi:citrate lyase subunit beta/citryl-CoA lyase
MTRGSCSPGATESLAGARTLLFVPGSRPDRFDKAVASGAHVVVVDLEDAVPELEKGSARAAVASWFGEGAALVRINALASPHHDADVQALAGAAGLRGVVVPMAEDPSGFTALAERLGDGIPVVALVETATGLHRVHEIAATACVRRLAFGQLDFAADVGSSTDDAALLMARSTLVVASRAAALPGPIDGPTTALDDPGLAAADARRAKALGFTGKLCIYPSQVAPVNEAFAPTGKELAWARRVAEAASGGGAVRVDGQMVDAPVVQRARDLLALEGDP